MDCFDQEYAKKLRSEHKYSELVSYCSAFSTDGEVLALLAICYHNGESV